MSTSTATRPTRRAKPATRNEADTARPVVLEVLTRGALRWRRFRRFLFYVACGFLALVMLTVAGVHAELVQGQREIDNLRIESRELRAERASLQRDVVEASSPNVIIAQAIDLGMVRAEEPVYLTVVQGPAATDPSAGLGEQVAAQP